MTIFLLKQFSSVQKSRLFRAPAVLPGYPAKRDVGSVRRHLESSAPDVEQRVCLPVLLPTRHNQQQVSPAVSLRQCSEKERKRSERNLTLVFEEASQHSHHLQIPSMCLKVACSSRRDHGPFLSSLSTFSHSFTFTQLYLALFFFSLSLTLLSL